MSDDIFENATKARRPHYVKFEAEGESREGIFVKGGHVMREGDNSTYLIIDEVDGDRLAIAENADITCAYADAEPGDMMKVTFLKKVDIGGGKTFRQFEVLIVQKNDIPNGK